jgi:hypothetical protein
MADEEKNKQPDAEKTLDEAAKVRYLEAGDFELLRSDGGGLRLTLAGDRSVLRVKARRCFPYSFGGKYISIRDGADEEIGIVRDLGEIPKQYRRWIEDDLERRYFTPQVKSITTIRHRFGGVEWHVLTDRGPKRLITRGVHDTMTEIEPGRYIIADVDGNRYELSPEALDEASRAKVDKLI